MIMGLGMKKNRKITLADMEPHVHSFLPQENKVNKIYNWLSSWIKLSLECGKISPYDLLPTKADLACHISVSQGTVQSVYRLLEDAGFVESKQRAGTYIKDPRLKKTLDKLTSKRELAIEIVKKHILENRYEIGDKLISARSLARKTGLPNSTVRFAITSLMTSGILDKKRNVFILKSRDFSCQNIELKTLVEKVADSMQQYIKEEFKPGEKLPSSVVLKEKFNVSLKTIHDAIKILSKEGLLYSRRGQYGTIVLGEYNRIKEDYCYEKIEKNIRQYIIETCQIGDKLPSIKEFAQMYKTSEKTIKKSLNNLSEEGYLTFTRGRYGGTFVMDIPQSTAEAYKWLALNSDYKLD